MINRNSERATKPSFVPKFSDPDLIKAVLSPEFWRHVFLGEKKAVWLFFMALVNLKMEMFISPLRVYLRYGHGYRTAGAMITLMSVSMMMAFNTEHLIGALATFFPLAAPIVPFFMDGEDMALALFVDVRSHNLKAFWMGYVPLSVVHLVGMYRAAGGQADPARRGTSILYMLAFRFLRVPEHIVQRLAEPLLVGAVGHALISTGADPTFGLFLVIGAGCLFFQEGVDAVMKFSITQ